MTVLDPRDPTIEARAEALLAELDLDERAALTAGRDDWRITGAPGWASATSRSPTVPRVPADAPTPAAWMERMLHVDVRTRTGWEVVQVYVEPPAGPVARPVRQLAGFAKVHLAPEESRTVLIPVPARAFAYWDPTEVRWQVAEGEHTLRVGRSSRDLTGWVTVEPGARALTTLQA